MEGFPLGDNIGEELPCKVLTSEDTKGSFEGFANALSVWINKPHVVNRRLCGTKLKHFKVSSRSNLPDILKEIRSDADTEAERLAVPEDSTVSVRSRDQFHEQHHSELPQEVEALSEYSDDGLVVIVRELLPKQPDRFRNIPELIVYDKSDLSCTFHPLPCFAAPDETVVKDSTQVTVPEVLSGLSDVTYKFSYSSDPKRIELSVSSVDFSVDSERSLSLTWLQNQLLKKLARWSEEPKLKTSLTSLKLIDLDQYNRLYSDLKQKYGLHFAKIWPETTDPQKFVFEDVAIATYLLLLWKQDRERKNLTRKQSFADLGCGNGLLVHILASEGHPGQGIDIRRRNIWDLYGPETVLKEMSITPSADSLFPDVDWLIGNHSDELTPWIPVMAARSSYTCSFFVLPCCHFDFDSRFNQKSVGTSQYRTYLDFVQLVGEQCGFGMEEDMIRIPSTKRVCFVGRTRTYPLTEEGEIDSKRTAFIKGRCKQTEKDDQGTAGCVKSESWASEFQPRDKIEVPRNCVSVRKETKECVIRTVFDKLLSSDTQDVRQTANGREWRKGGTIPISEVANMFDRNLLQEMKSECGGLQTMLRNSSNIFQVSGGVVQLRDFTLADPWGKSNKGKRRKDNENDFWKTGMCWFHSNHPDGCPLVAEQCRYAHTKAELRERPAKFKKVI